jgi:hypothetical protein
MCSLCDYTTVCVARVIPLSSSCIELGAKKHNEAHTSCVMSCRVLNTHVGRYHHHCLYSQCSLNAHLAQKQASAIKGLMAYACIIMRSHACARFYNCTVLTEHTLHMRPAKLSTRSKIYVASVGSPKADRSKVKVREQRASVSRATPTNASAFS